MNISSLLMAFPPERGGSEPLTPDAVAPHWGAEFAALFASPDPAFPVPTPKVPAPKAVADDALILPDGEIALEAERAVPVFWQTIVSDSAEAPKPFDREPLSPDDAVDTDAAMALCLAPPAAMQPDPKGVDAFAKGVALPAAPSGAAPQDFPLAVLAAQALPQAQTTDVAADTVPRQPDQTLLAQMPNIAPPSPPRADASAHPDQAAQGQGGKVQSILDKVSGPTVPLDRSDRAAGLDFIGAVEQGAAQVPIGVPKGATPSLEPTQGALPQAALPQGALQPRAVFGALGQTRDGHALSDVAKGLAHPVAVVHEGAAQGLDVLPKTNTWVAPKFEAAAPPPSSKTASENLDQGPLATPVLGFKIATPLPAAQNAPNPAPSSFTAGQGAPRLPGKPDPAQRILPPIAAPVKAAVLPFYTRLAQAVQPIDLGAAPSDALAKGDQKATEFAVASVDAPQAAFGAALPPTAAALTTAPLAPSTDALPPKPALSLHQLPALIDHLHQGAARDGHSHAELLMNPAELGRIRFDLITQGDQVQVTLSVERPETLDLLRANTEALRQEFRAAGLTADTLNFGQWSQRPPARDQTAAPPDQAAPAQLPHAIPAPYIKPPSTSGLDLRL
jgi:hypothetical protein